MPHSRIDFGIVMTDVRDDIKPVSRRSWRREVPAIHYQALRPAVSILPGQTSQSIDYLERKKVISGLRPRTYTTAQLSSRLGVEP